MRAMRHEFPEGEALESLGEVWQKMVFIAGWPWHFDPHLKGKKAGTCELDWGEAALRRHPK